MLVKNFTIPLDSDSPSVFDSLPQSSCCQTPPFCSPSNFSTFHSHGEYFSTLE